MLKYTSSQRQANCWTYAAPLLLSEGGRDVKNVVVGDVTPCGSGKNRCLHYQSEENPRARKNVNNKQLHAEKIYPDDGGEKFLRNVRSYKSHTASHLRRRHSS
jgi:hypothetical protein